MPGQPEDLLPSPYMLPFPKADLYKRCGTACPIKQSSLLQVCVVVRLSQHQLSDIQTAAFYCVSYVSSVVLNCCLLRLF